MSLKHLLLIVLVLADLVLAFQLAFDLDCDESSAGYHLHLAFDHVFKDWVQQLSMLPLPILGLSVAEDKYIVNLVVYVVLQQLVHGMI